MFTEMILEVEPKTLGDALKRYESQVTPRKKSGTIERYRIRQWLHNDLASRPLRDLKGRDFIAYREARLATGASTSTVRLELAIISNLYTVCAREWGYEDIPNPIQKMRLPKPAKGRTRRLMAGEESALLTAADNVDSRIKPLILFALETAMRRGEMLKLQWRDVSIEKRAVLLHDTKNGDPRTVPLSRKAIAILEEVRRDVGQVFPYSGAWISNTFRAVCQVAELKDLRFHDLRHEATSRLFELGRFTLVEISMITGHKDLHMLKRYTHLTAMQLAARLD